MASVATRGSLWEDSEIGALISIWGETNVQEELDGAVRDKVRKYLISCKIKAITEIGNSAEQN